MAKLNVASLLRQEGKALEARALYEEVVRGCEEGLGSQVARQKHALEADVRPRLYPAARRQKHALDAKYGLACILQRDDKVAAKALWLEVAAGYAALHGASHPETVDAQQGLQPGPVTR